MQYDIIKDGTFFRVTLNGLYEDSDPLYNSRSEAQKAIVRYQARDSAQWYQDKNDRAYTYLQGYFV